MSQRRLCHKLAERAISADESASSVDEMPDLAASNQALKDEFADFQSTGKYRYLDDIMQSLTNENRRLLAMYLKIETKIGNNSDTESERPSSNMSSRS